MLWRKKTAQANLPMPLLRIFLLNSIQFPFGTTADERTVFMYCLTAPPEVCLLFAPIQVRASAGFCCTSAPAPRRFG